MWQFQGVFMLLAVTLGLSLHTPSICFHCGDDTRPKCPSKMSLSLSDLDRDKLCFGFCLKFNGTAILLPGLYTSSSLRYLSVNSPELIFDLVNAKPGTNHSTNPTNPNGNSKR